MTLTMRLVAIGLALAFSTNWDRTVHAQWYMQPIKSRYGNLVPVTVNGKITDDGPIERVSMHFPTEVQNAIEKQVRLKCDTNTTGFFFAKYAPRSLEFRIEATGMERTQGMIGNAKQHEFAKFYPLVCMSDDYVAYAQGIWVVADLVAKKQAIVRVQFDMDLVYDETLSVTRIKGISAWRQPLDIRWSRLDTGLGKLKAGFDLTPAVSDSKSTVRNSSSARIKPADKPMHGIDAVFETQAGRRENDLFIADVPVSLQQRVEQALATKWNPGYIVFEVNRMLVSYPVIKTDMPSKDGQSTIQSKISDQVASKTRMSVLLQGSDEHQSYVIATLFVTQPETRLSALLTAELNVPLSATGGKGAVYWSGPFVGDWQTIRGFDGHDITSLVHPLERADSKNPWAE